MASGDWGTGTTGIGHPGASDRWGNGVNSRAGSPVSLDGASPTWTARAQGNNPCPAGWRVPSRFEWWDIYRGDGSNNPSNVTTDAYNNILNQNTWSLRASYLNALGGVIITNKNDESLFLPIIGTRSWNNASYSDGVGYYRSSTIALSGSSYYLTFSTGGDRVNAGSNIGNNTIGTSVRCVSE